MRLPETKAVMPNEARRATYLIAFAALTCPAGLLASLISQPLLLAVAIAQLALIIAVLRTLFDWRTVFGSDD